MKVVKAEVGAIRGPDDGSRRFLPDRVLFDTRAMALSTVIEDSWEPDVKRLWESNQAEIREVLIHEFGARDYESKIRNFIDLGAAPWSLVALHNVYLAQVRQAFVSLDYYAALLGACGLGERILNQLVLTLRGDFPDHASTRYVEGKKSLDDWDKCIKALLDWEVIDDLTAREYRSLMGKRHAAVHYRSELDGVDARATALAAVTQLSDIVGRIFSPMGASPFFFTGPIGRSFVRRSAETLPFVRHFVLPACVLVSPVFRYVTSGGDLVPYDDPSYGVGKPNLSDDEFADPVRAAHQVPHPF